jgi:hypothetical protein
MTLLEKMSNPKELKFDKNMHMHYMQQQNVLMKGKEWTQNGLRSQALQRWNAQILCYE